jgi:GcrA cell cycle regulator
MAFDSPDPHALDARAAARGRSRFNWSAERIALLKRRWAEGASASTIAGELAAGLSRCAVLGKVHRLKLTQPAFKRLHPAKEKVVFKRRRAPHRPRVRAPSQLMAALEALGVSFAAADLRTVEAYAGKAFGAACSLLELGEATCRWPLGEPDEAGFAFCGAVPLARYPYCPAHCLIAYRPLSAEHSQSAPASVLPVQRDRGARAA